MKYSEMIRITCRSVAYLCMAYVMTSCSNGGEAGEKCDSDNSDCESTTNIAGVVATVEKPHMQTQEERFMAGFKHLVTLKRTETGEKSTRKVINELCNEICGLPREQALPLLDQFADMAISQPVTVTNYSLRSAWYEQLFYGVHDAFSAAQYLQKESYGRWDKLFSFFAKCTDEITSMEESLPLTNSRFWGRGNEDKGMYLLGLREDVKTWVHVMRDFYFPELSKGLTEEQKADVLRRFDELKKFTDTPSDFPGGKK